MIGYLDKRGILLDIANSSTVQEMHYIRQGKPYFALAFANERGGDELRNPYFKGTYGVKDITIMNRGTDAHS